MMLDIKEQLYYRRTVKSRAIKLFEIFNENEAQLIADQALWQKMKPHIPEGVTYLYEVYLDTEDENKLSGPAIYHIIENRKKIDEREKYLRENQDILSALIF